MLAPSAFSRGRAERMSNTENFIPSIVTPVCTYYVRHAGPSWFLVLGSLLKLNVIAQEQKLRSFWVDIHNLHVGSIPFNAVTYSPLVSHERYFMRDFVNIDPWYDIR